MMEVVAGRLTVALIVGVVGTVFKNPILHIQTIFPLVNKLGFLFLTFGLGFLFGSKGTLSEIDWQWFLLGGVALNLSGLVFFLLAWDIEKNN